MRRGPIRMAVAVTVAILLGACTDGDDTAASSTTQPTAATTGAPATAPVATTTLAPITTSTAVPGSTTSTVTPPTIVPVPGTLALTRVTFGTDPYAVITNVGNAPVDLDGQWLVSGTNTVQLDPPGTGTLQPGRTALIVLGGEQPPQFVGMEAVVDVGTALGTIDASGGELLLSTAVVNTDTDSVLDYVAWGVGPHLNQTVAVLAGIWSRDASVELAEEAVSISSPGTLGGGVEDWAAVIGG